MPLIKCIQTQTTIHRLELAPGVTAQDVVRLLNGGYATFLYPETFPSHRGSVYIVRKDEKGYPDQAQVLATLVGSAGHNTGQTWRVGLGEDVVKELLS